tara:strand:- start:670 stop:1398 length:729 start_codon:yes stop_codon:yes gene_type:complete
MDGPTVAAVAVSAAIALTLLTCLLPFLANYITDFLPKWSGFREDVKLIDVDLPSTTDIHEWFVDGVKKDPSRNFQHSSCTKLDHPGIEKACPCVLEAFHTPDFAQRCARALGLQSLQLNSAEVDVNCIFLRRYVEGDFLAFHYDNNFSRGVRYTAVIPLRVTDENTSEFIMIDAKNRIQIIHIPVGKAVVYNGWQIRHAITGQCKGGERIVAVVHLYTDASMNWFGKWRKWARDITYRRLSL